MKNIFTFSILALVAFVSCSKVEGELGGELDGSLRVNSVADSKLNVSEQGGYNIPTPSFYKAVISKDGQQVWGSDAFSGDSTIQFMSGAYKMTLASGVDTATFGVPSYVGSTNFTIKRGVKTDVNVTVKLTSVVVDVNYSANVTSHFADYRTTVWAEGGNSLVFDGTKVDSLGYFKTPVTTLHYKIEVTTKQGFKYSKSDKVTRLVAGDLLKLNFDIDLKPSDESEPLVMDLLLERELNEIESSFEFGATLESTGVPTITGRLIDLAKPLGVKHQDGSTIKIDLTTKGKMSRLLFMFKSGMGIEGFGQTIDIMAMSATQQAALGVRFETGGSINSEASLMDISVMTQKMPLSESFSLTIGVLDQNGQYAARELIFNVYGVAVTTLPTVLNADKIDWLGVSGAVNMVNVTLQGRYNLDVEPDGMMFMYRKKGDATWSTVTDFVANATTKVVTAVASVRGGGDIWEYKIAADDESGDTYTFTTPLYPVYDNLSLDNWGDGARANPSNWSSPNYDGVLGIGVVNSTSRQVGRTGSGYAARIVSGDAAGQFASGGLFTGSMKVDMNAPYKSAQVGKEFSGRPKKLVGYFKYKSNNIHRVGSTDLPGNGAKNGQPDMCEIAVKLEKWSGGNYSIRWRDGFFGNPGAAYLDKTGAACDSRKAQVQDFDGNGSGPSDIREQISVGYGKITSTGTDDWTRFEIDIQYYQNIMPDRLIITAVSSAWGGYMSGAEGSEMWIDDLEFVY